MKELTKRKNNRYNRNGACGGCYNNRGRYGAEALCPKGGGNLRSGERDRGSYTGGHRNRAGKTEPTTSSVGIGVQPIGEYSLNGYIVVTGDAAMEMYSIASTKLKEYAASANNLASKIPSSKVYVMLAPTRMEFYGPEEYRTGSHSQQMGISTAYLALNPEVTGVDAYSEIARHTDEYEYFRTDHHWTARGAYYAYKAFCESAGLTCTPLDSFQSGKLDDFVGSMYRYTQSETSRKTPTMSSIFSRATM